MKWADHITSIFKGCLPQILLGPFLNTLTQILINYIRYILGPTIKYLSGSFLADFCHWTKTLLSVHSFAVFLSDTWQISHFRWISLFYNLNRKTKKQVFWIVHFSSRSKWPNYQIQRLSCHDPANITCSKLSMETLEKAVKYVQS